MSELTIPSAAFGLTCLVVAVVGFAFASNKIHRLWSFFNFLVASWGIGLFFLSIADNPASAYASYKPAFIAGTLIAVVFYHFCMEFSTKVNRLFLTVAYLQAFLYIFLDLFFYPAGYEMSSATGYFYPRSANWIFTAHALCWFFFSGYGFFLICQGLISSKGEQKIQYKYLLLSTAIGFSFGGAAHYMTAYGHLIHPSWNYLIVVYSLLSTYAVFRHRLLGIDFAIRKGLAYSLLLSVISCFYFLSFVILEKIFQRTLGYDTSLPTVAVLGVVLFISEPIRQKIQALIDYVFYKGSISEVAQQREMLHEEIRKQDRMKAVATLAAGMAHEIKNPLTTIKTFAEHLPRKYHDADFREKFNRLVVEEVDRVNRIVKQLLDFSKPEQLSLEKERIVLLLEDTLDFLNSDFLDKKIEVVRDYKGDVEIEVDRNQMRQAFLNIFLNGIQAMPGGGTLTVSTELVKDSFRISIRDTGYGIRAEDLPHVFDPFFSRKEEGTGLGLSIVHGIVTKHEGKIGVKSEVGKGTCVSVTLKSRG